MIKRAVSADELKELGLTDEQIAEIVQAQETPKPRLYWYKFQALEDDANEVQATFPEINIIRGLHNPKKKK